MEKDNYSMVSSDQMGKIDYIKFIHAFFHFLLRKCIVDKLINCNLSDNFSIFRWISFPNFISYDFFLDRSDCFS